MLYSIGHSTMSQGEFLRLVYPLGLDVIMDIRSHPTSKWPQFRAEEMKVWLPAAGKKYEWEPRLGGWTERHFALVEEMRKLDVDLVPYMKGKFPKQRIAKDRPTYPLFEKVDDKPAWTNQGLYDYSVFMSLPEFVLAADILTERGKTENIGILCCETLWWRCHRSMVSDFIVWRGADIMHLQPKQVLHSKCIGNRLQRYDTRILAKWQELRAPVAQW